MWGIASASGVLDVNSRYAYLLWCRDFAGTSVVARSEGEPVGFVTAYRRPDEQGTLFVWQVAVVERARGLGVAGAMLEELVRRVPGIDHLEATVTADNLASAALFTAFARKRGASVHRAELFGTNLLGAGHEAELLFRIGPINQEMRQSQ